MSRQPVDPRATSALRLWARRMMPTVVFDRDDARQEIALALWLAGESGSGISAYRRVVDAMRRLIPGFQQRNQLFVANSDDIGAEPFDPADTVTPDDVLYAHQIIALLGTLTPAQQAIVSAIVAGKTAKEVAADMGVSGARVSQQLAAVRAAIVKAQQPCRPQAALAKPARHRGQAAITHSPRDVDNARAGAALYAQFMGA